MAHRPNPPARHANRVRAQNPSVPCRWLKGVAHSPDPQFGGIAEQLCGFLGGDHLGGTAEAERFPIVEIAVQRADGAPGRRGDRRYRGGVIAG